MPIPRDELYGGATGASPVQRFGGRAGPPGSPPARGCGAGIRLFKLSIPILTKMVRGTHAHSYAH
jgi:hypothetical protein